MESENVSSVVKNNRKSTLFTMCSKNCLFHCMSIETLCSVLAIINVIFNLLNLVWFTVLWVAIAILYKYRGHMFDTDDFAGVNLDIETWHQNPGHVVFYFGIIPLASFVTAFYSFLLFFGINRGRPGQVRAYLMYGIIITVLGTGASIVLVNVDDNPCAGLWVLFVCIIHLLFLLLVFKTLRKMSDGSRFADNIRLIVEDDRYFKSGSA